MLMSLLPGLRHVRTPLVAGSLWFVAIWIGFGSDRLLPDPAGSEFEQRLHALSDLVGPNVALAAVGFAAVLLGGLIPTVPLRLLGNVYRGARLLLRRADQSEHEQLLAAHAHDVMRRVAHRVRWKDLVESSAVPRVAYEYAFGFFDHLHLAGTDQALREELDALHNRHMPADDFSEDAIPHSVLQKVIEIAPLEENDQLTTQLQLQAEVLYNDVDRLNSEAELRSAVFLPMVILIVELAVFTSWFALGLLIVPALLAADGVRAQNLAQLRVAGALAHGTVKSPTIEYLLQFADNPEIDPAIPPPSDPWGEGQRAGL